MILLTEFNVHGQVRSTEQWLSIANEARVRNGLGELTKEQFLWLLIDKGLSFEQAKVTRFR